MTRMTIVYRSLACLAVALFLTGDACAQYATRYQAQATQATVQNQTPILYTREQVRVIEKKDGGFNWMPWLSAGERIWKFVIARNPKAKSMIDKGDQVDVAVYDLNYDGSNEVILSFWGNCGIDGCLYMIYFNSERAPVSFFGHTMRPFGHGVKLDTRYFRL